MSSASFSPPFNESAWTARLGAAIKPASRVSPWLGESDYSAHDEAASILGEHPLLQEVVADSEDATFRYIFLTLSGPASLSSVAGSLSRLAIKEGGEEAAKRMHRYLVDGANHSLPAHEVAVFHGLTVDRCFELASDAYLAPYAHAKERWECPAFC